MRVWMVLLGFALAACATQLESAQARWKSQNLSHYQYTVRMGCFCPTEFLIPLRIRVQNGLAVSVTNAETGAVVSDSRFDSINTIDKLFELIRATQAKPEAQVKVEYDPTLGFPTSIALDPIVNAVDDEVSYSLSDFSTLP